MDKATLEKLLDLTGQVFAGSIRRAGLLTMKPQQKAFTGTAIMWATSENEYYILEPEDLWCSDYGVKLANITQRGLLNPYELPFREDSPSYWTSPENLQNAGIRAGLYAHGRLLFVPELVEFVIDRGRTPAIEQFLLDIEIGRRQEQQWRRNVEDKKNQEYDALQNIKLLGSDLPPTGAFLDEVVRQVRTLYGKRGLHDLRTRLNQELDSQ